MVWQCSAQGQRLSSPCHASGFLLLCTLLALLPGSVAAFDNEESRATLRGLVGIEVGVGEITPEIARAGVTLETIRKHVSQRLQRAGITVLNREELLQRADAAFLAVTVGAIRHPGGQLYAYSIDVSVYQTATLLRDAGIVLSLPTWSIASFGIVSSANLRALLDSIGKRVEQFIRAHRAVNPRAEASKTPRPGAKTAVRTAAKAPRKAPAAAKKVATSSKRPAAAKNVATASKRPAVAKNVATSSKRPAVATKAATPSATSTARQNAQASRQ
ncbi:MAG: hypothetical protein AB7N91_20685 [Candidatus Tectimicrobiota bacterium]